jgi:ribulose-phosphate 3-epimerase
MNSAITILPSLLAADFGELRAGARQAEAAGGDALHIDVMDGVFVPNISMGPEVVRMAKDAVGIPINVHLMISNPAEHVAAFIDAGADTVLIHVEIDGDVAAVLDAIRDKGAIPGITLNPGTDAGAVLPFLPAVDEVLCMTVNPGHGGQSFMPEVLPKIREIRLAAPDLRIMVDGGITTDTVKDCAAQGANVFVAGAALYNAPDMAAEIQLMRANAAAQCALQ